MNTYLGGGVTKDRSLNRRPDGNLPGIYGNPRVARGILIVYGLTG